MSFLSSIWVFGLIAIAHWAMIVINPAIKYTFALTLGFGGFFVIYLTRFCKNDGWQSFLGALGGMSVWTSFEYSLIWGAQRMDVNYGSNLPPEYRIMKFTFMACLMVCMYLLFQEGVRCKLIIFLRKKLKLMRGQPASGKIDNYGPRTAFQVIMITWFLYCLLLIGFDDTIFGPHSTFIYVIFFGSFGIFIYLFYKLMAYRKFGPNLRYAIPTIMVIWNNVEILSEWNMFREPWVNINRPIMTAIISGFLISSFLIYHDLTGNTLKYVLRKKSALAYAVVIVVGIWGLVSYKQSQSPDQIVRRKISTQRGRVSRCCGWCKATQTQPITQPETFGVNAEQIKGFVYSHKWDSPHTQRLAHFILNNQTFTSFELQKLSNMLRTNLVNNDESVVNQTRFIQVISSLSAKKAKKHYSHLARNHIHEFKPEHAGTLGNSPNNKDLTAFIKGHNWDKDKTKKMARYLIKKIPSDFISDLSAELITKANAGVVDWKTLCEAYHDVYVNKSVDKFIRESINHHIEDFKRSELSNQDL